MLDLGFMFILGIDFLRARKMSSYNQKLYIMAQTEKTEPNLSNWGAEENHN